MSTGSHRRLRAPTQADVLAATKLVAVCRAVEAGLALVTGRTADPRLAVAARSAGASVASIRARIGDQPAKALLRDRLRLEWLASSVAPGRSDVRLLEECARLLAECLRALPARHAYREEAARLRVAHVEAHSLARACLSDTEGDLLFVPV